MPLNEPVSKVHGLHEIHLLPVRRRARIFPDQPFAVGEKALAVALPQ
jgi:hypothetical protein